MAALADNLPTVAVLACGGTIAGVGDAGKSIGYTPGALGVEDLLGSCGYAAELAHLEPHQVCNVNSDDMTSAIWLDLARRIEVLACRSEICGIVILHGTDTMEETAFFLDLVVSTDKPVVLTGSMHPATAPAPDGPGNLCDAVVVASSSSSCGRGVQVVFDGKIFAALTVRKASTRSVSCFDAGVSGCAGTVCDGQVRYFAAAARRLLCGSFGLGDREKLPDVVLLPFYVDANPALVHAAASCAEGVVIAGAGAGEFSLSFAQVLDSVQVPVVVASRVCDAYVADAALLCKHAVAAGSLSPQKAVVLLRVALAATRNADEAVALFGRFVQGLA